MWLNWTTPSQYTYLRTIISTCCSSKPPLFLAEVRLKNFWSSFHHSFWTNLAVWSIVRCMLCIDWYSTFILSCYRYCTGGIRCETASAYLRSKGDGFENVFQVSSSHKMDFPLWLSAIDTACYIYWLRWLYCSYWVEFSAIWNNFQMVGFSKGRILFLTTGMVCYQLLSRHDSFPSILLIVRIWMFRTFLSVL